jgi:hypothetical protein
MCDVDPNRPNRTQLRGSAAEPCRTDREAKQPKSQEPAEQTELREPQHSDPSFVLCPRNSNYIAHMSNSTIHKDTFHFTHKMFPIHR